MIANGEGSTSLEPVIASSAKLLARHPNEFVLYEVLEYTTDARVPRARLLGHGPNEEELVKLMNEYRLSQPDACLGLHWSGFEKSDELILML